ncbi:MAG TPA: glycine zipper 2TM domain-containing protein [Noviherbaspirillum sp.]|uniref:glycine zipper 2TM domain-containing protein n=1 Tax=Noviherbaspirillum sp. TaxID=1926288 RepID=UPI002F9223F1
MNTRLVAAIFSAVTLVSTVSGCASRHTVGTVGGAALGGAAGHAISGGSTLGTVGGAAVGGVLGSEVSK